MPKGNRIIRFAALAFVLAAIIFVGAWSCQPLYLGEAEAPSTKSESKPEYDRSNGSRTVTCYQDCQVHFGPREYPETGENNDSAGDGRSESDSPQYTREGLDLLAQRRMAYWAIWLAGFTLIGLILLAGTFWEAFEGAKAARAAVEATEKVGKNQTQAYLSVESAVVRLRRHQTAPGPEEWGVNVEIRLKNYGQSPAKQVTIECEDARVWALATCNKELGFFEDATGAFIGYHEFTQNTFSSDIAPGAIEPARMYSELLSATDTPKLLERMNRVSVKGKVKWVTEFDDVRVHPFHIETAPFFFRDLVDRSGAPDPEKVVFMDRLPHQQPPEEPKNT